MRHWRPPKFKVGDMVVRNGDVDIHRRTATVQEVTQRKSGGYRYTVKPTTGQPGQIWTLFEKSMRSLSPLDAGREMAK